MENKNTIELNVVRLGGKSNGRVPTKLSEMENDCNFIDRNAFMQGQLQKQIGCYIECGVEYKVLTKTKGQEIRIRFTADPSWGSMSNLYKLQLIIKDMNGNEVVRFPSEDALNNKLATPSYGIFNTNIYFEYVPDDGGASIVCSEPIPEECELYLSRIDNSECFVVANTTIDGYMTVEQTMDKFSQSLANKADSSALGTAAFKNVEDLQGGVLTNQSTTNVQEGSSFSLKIPLDASKKRLIHVDSYFREVTIRLTDDMSLDTNVEIGNNIGHSGTFQPRILFEPCTPQLMKVTISELYRNISKVCFIDPNITNLLSIETASGNLDLTITQDY